MRLSVSEICAFTQSTPTSRNFVEGEKVLNAGHMIFCGRGNDTGNGNSVEFLAFCLQTSNMTSRPHEINGLISLNGKVVQVKCSCKAGLSDKCKHSVAVLLHLSRVDVNDLDEASSTDKRCLWNEPQVNSLAKYSPNPLSDHECFSSKFKKECSITITDEQRKKINELLVLRNPQSALYKHMAERHEPLVIEHNNNELKVTEDELIKNILEIERSECMLELLNTEPKKPSKICCVNVLNSLKIDDNVTICVETLKNRSIWKENRRYRITGSRCYSLYTCTKNISANWKKKTENYFYPKEFTKTEAMKHGIEVEPFARDAYETNFNVKIVQLGLVVSPENPWLAYTPDGVTLDENNRPEKLIEIKCPFSGKVKSIKEVVSSLHYLDKNYCLKIKHAYYGQVQL